MNLAIAIALMPVIKPIYIITIVVTLVMIGLMIFLYVYGDKMQKKQMESREQMKAAAQPMTMMIIDKKYVKMKEANLPKMVMDQTPKRFHNQKVPIVKAKIGPQIMNLMVDEEIYDTIPNKGEIKAMVSGIYIISAKVVRGKVIEDPKKKKKGFGQKMRDKQAEYRRQLDAESQKEKISKEEKARRKKSQERASKIKDSIK